VFFAYALAGWRPDALAASLREAWPLLSIHVPLQILIIGLGEELGWRGWLLPSLTARYGLSGATLFTGIIWYIWHFPILLGVQLMRSGLRWQSAASRSFIRRCGSGRAKARSCPLLLTAPSTLRWCS